MMRKRGQSEELLEKPTALNGSCLYGPHKSLHNVDFNSQCWRNEPHELRNSICEIGDNHSPQLEQQWQHPRLLLAGALAECGVGPVQTAPEIPALSCDPSPAACRSSTQPASNWPPQSLPAMPAQHREQGCAANTV